MTVNQYVVLAPATEPRTFVVSDRPGDSPLGEGDLAGTAHQGRTAALERHHHHPGHARQRGRPYVVDTLTAPDDNPWKSWLRFGGVDFFPDGKSAAICTWSGDVWIVSGIDSTASASSPGSASPPGSTSRSG
jgi:hypothetical protein